jgi:N-acetylneuraminate synthase
MDEINIGNKLVGSKHKPFIIAELSANHGQSLEKALRLVDAAAEVGADAIKLQTYTADTITIDVRKNEFFIDDPDSLWQGISLYELYQKAMTPWQWHKEIFERATSLGMTFFSTPFDDTAVDFLESLSVPCYKIASFENIDHGLLKKVARTNKPVIMSTGMASLEELTESVAVLKENGCKDLILLKCTSSYPAEPIDANIVTISKLRELFGCQIGLSDHTLGLGVSVASVALGATVIEKHFVLDRNDNDIDSAFSLEPEELKNLIVETKRAWQSLGEVSFTPTPKEVKSQKHRRSLYICEDLKAGDVLNEKNLRSIRPGLGLAPKHLDEVLGKAVKQNVAKGTALSWELI